MRGTPAPLPVTMALSLPPSNLKITRLCLRRKQCLLFLLYTLFFSRELHYRLFYASPWSSVFTSPPLPLSWLLSAVDTPSSSCRDRRSAWFACSGLRLGSSRSSSRGAGAEFFPPSMHLAAASTVDGDSLSGLSYHPHKAVQLDRVMLSPVFSSCHSAASALYRCAGVLTRAWLRCPLGTCLKKHALFFINASPFSGRVASTLGSFPTLGRAQLSTTHRPIQLPGATGSSGCSRMQEPEATFSVCDLPQPHRGEGPVLCRRCPIEAELQTTDIRKEYEWPKDNWEHREERPPLPPMAASARSCAAFAALYISRSGIRYPGSATGILKAAILRLAPPAFTPVAAAARGALPAASPIRDTLIVGTTAARLQGSAFPAFAAPLAQQRGAFTACAASCHDALDRAAADSAGRNGHHATNVRWSPCTQLRHKEGNTKTNTSSPIVLQHQRAHKHQWRHCCIAALPARSPAWVLRMGRVAMQRHSRSFSPQLLQQQHQPILSSAWLSSFSKAAARKHTGMGVYADTSTVKDSKELFERYPAALAVAGRLHSTARGQGPHTRSTLASNAEEAGREVGADVSDSQPKYTTQQPRGNHWQHASRFTHTKQIATIGPASWEYEEIERLFLSGVDVFRLNFSHGLLHEKHQQLQHVRSVEKKYGHPIAVLADLPGPKLRLGRFEGSDTIYLSAGATFIIDNADSVLGNEQRVALPNHTELLQALRPGDVLLLDDGKLKLQVVRQLDCSREDYEQLLRQRKDSRSQRSAKERQHEEGEEEQQGQHQQGEEGMKHGDAPLQEQRSRHLPVHPPVEPVLPFLAPSTFPDRLVGVECVVSVGGPLSGKKGVNIPAAALPLSALSARDRELARLVAGWGVDWIALSFVQRAEDVRELRKELNAQAALLSEETPGAFRESSSSSRSSSSSDSSSKAASPCALRSSSGPAKVVEQSLYGKEPSVEGALKLESEENRKSLDEHTSEMEQQQQHSSKSSRAHTFSAYEGRHVKRGGGVAVIVKIEKPVALENIEEILEEADGLMVARGDLGVELAEHAAWLPVVQKRLVKLCQEAGKPVVIATQMLDSMTHAPAPTRAELTDVANAVYDGADAVMLSGETAAGAAPAHVASTQLQGIQAVESDPHFWRLQAATRRRLVDKEAASAASCAVGPGNSGSHSAAGSGKSSSPRLSDTGAAGSASDVGNHASAGRGEGQEQNLEAAGAAAASGFNVAVAAAPEAIMQGGAQTLSVGDSTREVHTGDTTGRLRLDKEVHVGQILHREEERVPLFAEYRVEQNAAKFNSHLPRHHPGHPCLFPELGLGHLPWTKHRTRDIDVQMGEQKASEFAAMAAARRAAALAAIFSVRDDKGWAVSSHSNSKGRKATRRRFRTSVLQDALQCAKTFAGNILEYHEEIVADACWIAAAAEQASRLSGASSIVVFEKTGEIARRLAALRPVVPVVAVIPSPYVARELQLHWGIYPVVDSGVRETARTPVEEMRETEEEAGRRTNTLNWKEELKARVDSVKASSEGVGTTRRTEETLANPQAKHEYDGKRNGPQRRDSLSQLSFETRMSKAAALLVEEGMANANGDDKAVVVADGYKRKEGPWTDEWHGRAISFFPQISLCRVKAFL